MKAILLHIFIVPWFYLLMCRSFVWISSPRLPTWSTIRQWRILWFLGSNPPACRPPLSLWVAFLTLLKPDRRHSYFWFALTCLNSFSLQVRVNSLVCVGKILEYLDKWFVLDEILPFLQQIPSKEPAVLMGILGKVAFHFLRLMWKKNTHLHICDFTHQESTNAPSVTRSWASPKNILPLRACLTWCLWA